MKNNSRLTPLIRSILKAALLFFPEVGICLLILIHHELVESTTLQLAKHAFSLCLPCLESSQFLLSSSLFIFCLLAHLMRFLAFQFVGNSLFAGYSSSIQELLISLLIFVAYLVFLIDSLSYIHTVVKISLGIFDVVYASVAALALIVILYFVYSKILKKGN